MLLFLLLAVGIADAQVPGESQTSDAEQQRGALPGALDGIFPSADYLGPTPLIGVPEVGATREQVDILLLSSVPT